MKNSCKFEYINTPYKSKDPLTGSC